MTHFSTSDCQAVEIRLLAASRLTPTQRLRLLGEMQQWALESGAIGRLDPCTGLEEKIRRARRLYLLRTHRADGSGLSL